MKDETRQKMIAQIQEAVRLCIIAQDWLSLERMYSRLAADSFDSAVEILFGDVLTSARDCEIDAAHKVANFILHSTSRIPWRAGR